MNDGNYCPLRRANGNCLPTGESCTSVDDKICKALIAAYEEGKRDGVLAAFLVNMTTR